MKAIAKQAQYAHQVPALLAGLINYDEQRFNDKAIEAMSPRLKRLWGALKPRLKDDHSCGTFKLVGVFLVHAWKEGYRAHQRELADTRNEHQGDSGAHESAGQKSQTRGPSTGRRQPVPSKVSGMHRRAPARPKKRQNPRAGG